MVLIYQSLWNFEDEIGAKKHKADFLLHNTALLIQLFDQGIVKTFKNLSQGYKIENYSETIDDPTQPTAIDIAKSLSLLDVFHMLINGMEKCYFQNNF